MNPEHNDNELWSRLLKGETEALDRIYKLHFGSLFQYGMRLLQDEDQVKDSLHNLFVKLWENRKSLNQTDQIRYYLISSLRNIITNHRIKETRYERVIADDETVFDLKFTIESEYIRREEITEKTIRLSQAMNKLTPRQKEIIYLKYFEEMDYMQIAGILDLTIKGAYKLSARAHEALREIMQVDKKLLVLFLMELKNFHFLLK